MKEHMKNVHGPISDLKCDQCPFITTLNRSLKTHIQKKLSDQDIQVSDTHNCTICDYRCTDATSMSHHIESSHMFFHLYS